MPNEFIEAVMRDWRMEVQSDHLKDCLRAVLQELSSFSLWSLRDERLQVIVSSDADFEVWAYFPVHRRRDIARRLAPKPETKVLLAIHPEQCNGAESSHLKDLLRDHLGHALLYLRDPKAPNECEDAMRTWADACQT